LVADVHTSSVPRDEHDSVRLPQLRLRPVPYPVAAESCDACAGLRSVIMPVARLDLAMTWLSRSRLNVAAATRPAARGGISTAAAAGPPSPRCRAPAPSTVVAASSRDRDAGSLIVGSSEIQLAIWPMTRPYGLLTWVCRIAGDAGADQGLRPAGPLPARPTQHNRSTQSRSFIRSALSCAMIIDSNRRHT